MTDDRRDWIAKALVHGSAAAGAAILAPANHGVAGLVAAAATFATLVFDFADTTAKRRARDFVAELGDGDGERAVAALAAKKDDPAVRELVLESARALAESLSDCVIPALGRLTSEYLTAERPADAFFRGVRRLLADLSVDEYEALVDLLGRTSDLDVAASQRTVEVQYLALAQGDEPQLTYLRPYPPEQRAKGTPINERVGLGPVAHAVRLFQLLRVNGLAEEASAGGIGSWAGPGVVVLRFEIVHRMLALVRPG